MSDSGRMQVNVRDAVKLGAAIKKMSLTEVARASGREQCTLSNMLKRGKPSLMSMVEVLNSVDSKLMVEFPNGQIVELIIE